MDSGQAWLGWGVAEERVATTFDAALALAVLAASGQLDAAALARVAVFGELSLGGDLREAPGVLAVAEGARRAGIRRLIVPRERAREAQRSGVFCGAYSLVPNPAVTATSPTLEAIDQKL